MITSTDLQTAKKVLIKEINKEVRQAYNNQSAFRLLDIIADLAFSAATTDDYRFSQMTFEVAEYTRSLREFQTNVIGITAIKARARHLFNVVEQWKENKL